MNTRYKRKAIKGVGLWFAALPFLIIGEGMGGLFFSTMSTSAEVYAAFVLLAFFVIQYFAFFWGGAQLAKAKGYSTGMLAYGIFWPGQFVILAILLFALKDKFATPTGREKRRHRDASPVARIIRYRRNALVCNLVGALGVAAALAIVRHGAVIFGSRTNAEVAGIFAFAAGYAAIICGCWWWVRSKKWNDAIVCIGLSPLVPFVLLRSPRLAILYINSGVLLLSMVLMPVIMIAVVAVLPDKSGLPTLKRRDGD